MIAEASTRRQQAIITGTSRQARAACKREEGNRMRRRTFLAASATTLALPGVTRAASKRVLKFVPQADLAVLDPILTTAGVTRSHGYLVFDTLYGVTGPEDGFRAVPQMAAGHRVEDDGKTWRVTLRDGLVFHDGQKVLARDCVESLRRWGVRDTLGQALMARTDEISAVDDKTIIFRLKRPFPLLPDALGKLTPNICAIMPERLASTDPYKQITEMVGSGPYRFKADERVQGSRFVYERFAGYQAREGGESAWTSGPKAAHFDRIEWHVIPDPTTAAAALQSGEVDWWELPTSDLLPVLRRGGKIRVSIIDPTGNCALLRPNHLHPPFDNPAIRRALLGAIDQTEFMTAVMGDDQALWRTPCGFFTSLSPTADVGALPPLAGRRDNEKVRKDLQAAGYNGERVVLMVPQDVPNQKAMSEIAADMMRRVGMNVDYQAVDWGTILQRRASKNAPSQGGWNMFCTRFWGSECFSPAAHSPLRCNGGQAWFGWPSSPRIETLREQWFDAHDPGTQKALATEIQAQAFEDVPYYPLGLYYNPTAHRADLSGVLNGGPFFWNVRRT
jgi:peptide/nickel transport system substrate-binding protein